MSVMIPSDDLSRVENADEWSRAAAEAVRLTIRRMMRKGSASWTDCERTFLSALLPLLRQHSDFLTDLIETLSVQEQARSVEPKSEPTKGKNILASSEGRV